MSLTKQNNNTRIPFVSLLGWTFQLLHLCILSNPTIVQGWGKVGHEIVGEIAWHRLGVLSQNAIRTILLSSPCYPNNNSSSTKLSSPLAQTSTWADDMRYTQAYRWTTPLHYIDVQEKSYKDRCAAFSRDCQFVYDRDCANDFCVAGAISNYTAQILLQETTIKRRNNKSFHLRSTRDMPQREPATSCNVDAEALMFVTHFVGDIHQPLHVSRAGDKGGNTIHVYFPTRKIQILDVDRHPHLLYTNLHKVWDEDAIDRVMKEDYHDSQIEFFDAIQVFLSNETTEEINSWLACGNASKACTSGWARESLNFALTVAYVNTNNEQDVQINSTLSEEYYGLGVSVIRKRLAQAGVRLAYILENLLGVGESPTNIL